MTDEEKKIILNRGAEFCCPVCLGEFPTEPELINHRKEVHKEKMRSKKLIFFFESHDGKLIDMDEKRALVFGFDNPRNFKEYLGALETDDPFICSKSVEEIKTMNLQKIQPREYRKTVMRGGIERVY